MTASLSPPEPVVHNEATSGNRETIFSISVILVAIPAYLYMCSYQYEKGICSYYGIPSDLISLDIISNLTVCLSLFTAIYLVVICPYIAMTYILVFIKKKPELHSFVKYNILVACYGCAYWLSVTYDIDWKNTYFVAAAILIFTNWLAYKQYRYMKMHPERRSNTGTDKNIYQEISRIIRLLPDVFHLKETFLKDFKAAHALLISVLIVVTNISYNMGIREAYRKTEYEISTDKPGWVMIRKYGDDIIMKNLVSKRELGDGLSVIKLSQFSSLNFVTKRTGKLHLHSDMGQ